MKCPTNANGTVTKIGTSSVGTDLRPIKLVNGVPTAVSNDFVDTSSAQRISGNKTFNGEASFDYRFQVKENNPWIHLVNTEITRGTIPSVNKNTNIRFEDKNGTVVSAISHNYYKDGDASVRIGVENVSGAGTSSELVVARTYSGDNFVRASYRTYNASNTTDVVTIGSLQSSTDVIHTSGNETITGTKTFASGNIIRKTSIPLTPVNYTEGDVFTITRATNEQLGSLMGASASNSSSIMLKSVNRTNSSQYCKLIVRIRDNGRCDLLMESNTSQGYELYTIHTFGTD